MHLVAQAVSGRFDIGNLAQYSEALDYFAERLGTQFTRFTSTKKTTSDAEDATQRSQAGRCPPRS